MLSNLFTIYEKYISLVLSSLDHIYETNITLKFFLKLWLTFFYDSRLVLLFLFARWAHQ